MFDKQTAEDTTFIYNNHTSVLFIYKIKTKIIKLISKKQTYSNNIYETKC